MGTGAVVMCDTFSSSSSSPVTLTPRLRRGSAHSDYSPAMAFVCSASTALLTVGGDCLSPVRTPGPAPPAGPRLNRSELGNGRRDSHTRRLLFSSLVDLDLDDAENENRPIVSAYNHSPLPLVMASRPHSRSTTTSRPLVLPV